MCHAVGCREVVAGAVPALGFDAGDGDLLRQPCGDEDGGLAHAVLLRTDDLLTVVQQHPSGIAFIDPGSPWQNPFVESFNGKLRDELLAVEQSHTLLEAKIMAEDYRQQYNQHRPHCSLGYLTPNEFTLQSHHNNPELSKTLAH